MGDTHLQPPSTNVLDALYERPVSTWRARLPDNHQGQPEDGAAPRTGGRMRKDSKIGLRGLFSRSKNGKTDKDGEEGSQISSRSTGIRASLADLAHWPSRHHSSISDTASVDSRSTEYSSTRRPSHTGQLPWTPPPFFQVYPQAVKHATLAVCNIPVETLARHNKFAQEQAIGALEYSNDLSAGSKRDILKKRQRSGSLNISREWTSKIFVLVTSGFLLQYAAEGTFDRMPEKILQLTATSAAYASDLVPGRHWVLQVNSITDIDGNPLMDPKPRRSKPAAKENEYAHTMLLIFENAESMDDWLVVVRKEIEFCGGKKRVSETGQFEIDDPILARQAQPSNTADFADNFSRRPSHVSIPDPFESPDNILIDSTENPFATTHPSRGSIYTADYGSSTASMISSEGRRLDSLRDSSSSHRFSYMSSGQRTMITSADSSPACSPTRASFSSLGDDLQPSPKTTEVRLRPNASAIMSRRQSIQTLIEAPTELCSNLPANPTLTVSYDNEQLSPPSVPNFSVPHTAGRRFSLSTSAPNNGMIHVQQSSDHEKTSKTSRKSPPTALLMSRPLSIVIDQPSPLPPCTPKSPTMFNASESAVLQLSNAAVVGTSPEHGFYSRNSGHWSNPAGGSTDDTPRRIVPNRDLISAADDRGHVPHVPRPASSLDSRSTQRILPEIPPNKYFSRRRPSLLSESHSLQDSPFASAHVHQWKPVVYDKVAPVPKTSCSPKRSAPSLRPITQHAPIQLLAVDSDGKLLTARRSMPYLTEGPPPAPPPNCALPPIPRKYSHHNIGL
ncbi:hypothetical protein GGR50DRAFT_255055 [Xylaria sp. CBS 124048]|nr:hypothetical protein GGR50DRAFT_255055 [Xylaria sp. CBS 124048]